MSVRISKNLAYRTPHNTTPQTAHRRLSLFPPSLLSFAPVSVVCGVVDVPLFPRRLLPPTKKKEEKEEKEEKKAMVVLAIVHTAHSTFAHAHMSI